VNKYITKFTQVSHYALHKVNIDENKQECFLNGLNDGLAYALEARDFENLQGIVNKALVLENHKGVMENKHKLVRQHQPDSSSRPCVDALRTCVPSCSAIVSDKAIGSWTRFLYPAASRDSTPQQSPNSCCWESECTEDPGYPRPTTS
jgi:hypothetical protein